MLLLLLSFAAGALTTLSPCVLPMLPIVVGSSVSKNKLGPLVMALGLTASFTLVGVSAGILGSAFHIDPRWVKYISAALLGIAGLVLLVPDLQKRFANLLQPVSDLGNVLTRHLPQGLIGQFMLGAALGAIWSPCSSPTLGAALSLAAQSKNLVSSSVQMALFGLGASMPLIAVGYLSRQWLSKKSSLLQAGSRGKIALGVILLLVSVAILSGLDRRIEARILDHMPQAWIDLTIRL